jgi:hypothetical protein
MNIRRGLFRVWLVLTVVWVVAAILVQSRPPPPFNPNIPYEEWFADLPIPRTRSGCEEAAKKEPRVVIGTCVEYAHAQNWRDAEKVIWVVVPPILLLIFGVSVSWIRRGFAAS